MTVCIAALARDSESQYAIIAADRMVTLGNFIEFEHGVPKMITETGRAVVMVAGDTLTGVRLCAEVAEGIAGTNPPTLTVAQHLASHYEATRTARIEQQVLAPRGLDFNSYYARHASLTPQITVLLDQQISQFNLAVELLVAGFDPTGAHIYTIANPGRPEMLHDVIGYAAIGSGAIHAVQSMIGYQHTANAGYFETLFRVYAAKRRAEAAPGVGHETDMAVITLSGTHPLPEQALGQLEGIYDEFTTATSDALTQQLQALSLGDAGHNGSEDDAESHDDANTTNETSGSDRFRAARGGDPQDPG